MAPTHFGGPSTAWIEQRRRADRGLTARVFWRPGGCRDTPREWETFGARHRPRPGPTAGPAANALRAGPAPPRSPAPTALRPTGVARSSVSGGRDAKVNHGPFRIRDVPSRDQFDASISTSSVSNSSSGCVAGSPDPDLCPLIWGESAVCHGLPSGKVADSDIAPAAAGLGSPPGLADARIVVVHLERDVPGRTE